MTTVGSTAAAYRTTVWSRCDDGRLQCDACPRQCRLRDGQRGLCFVRERRGDTIVSTTYGRSSGFCVDPIEKKPLFHFLPGSPVLSFGTAGCNLSCRFCQNWEITRSREVEALAEEAPPDDVATAARRLGCRSVAFTYNDPVPFWEYAVDTAEACRAVGVRTVAVTAGYVSPVARERLFASVDAANIDLKAFTDDFYHRICAGHLGPVLETLEYVARHTSVWLEVTTLLVPGLNDSDAELDALTSWVAGHLGTEVPLHFSRFHPDHKLRDVPVTPRSSLERATHWARQNGLRHVYTGNVHDVAGATTHCTGCGQAVVVRDWYEILGYALDDDGRCTSCGTAMVGVFDGPVGDWGSRRRPVRIADLVSREASAPCP